MLQKDHRRICLCRKITKRQRGLINIHMLNLCSSQPDSAEVWNNTEVWNNNKPSSQSERSAMVTLAV